MPKKIKLEIIKGCDDNAYARSILQVQIRDGNWFIRNCLYNKESHFYQGFAEADWLNL